MESQALSSFPWVTSDDESRVLTSDELGMLASDDESGMLTSDDESDSVIGSPAPAGLEVPHPDTASKDPKKTKGSAAPVGFIR